MFVSFTTNNGTQANKESCVGWCSSLGTAFWFPGHKLKNAVAKLKHKKSFVSNRKFLQGVAFLAIELNFALDAKTTTTTVMMMMTNQIAYAQMPPSYSTTVYHSDLAAVSDRITNSK